MFERVAQTKDISYLVKPVSSKKLGLAVKKFGALLSLKFSRMTTATTRIEV